MKMENVMLCRNAAAAGRSRTAARTPSASAYAFKAAAAGGGESAAAGGNSWWPFAVGGGAGVASVYANPVAAVGTPAASSPAASGALFGGAGASSINGDGGIDAFRYTAKVRQR